MLYRPFVALCLVALFAWGAVQAVLRVVMPAAAPARVVPRKPVTPRLSKHLLLVIVDGLRYDVATDSRRMPRFAAAMRAHRSAEVWAGRVSMTSSAVLAYGTGQHGSLEQIIRNINPSPPAFNSWLANARQRGLVIASVGDPAWVEMYGAYISAHRQDPKGVAIDVDFNPRTFRDVRQLRGLEADFLVAHFGTPDHQGHAYGIYSKRYTEHIRDYDRQLDELLGEFGPEWTVMVTSDHGAADTGTHGTDVAEQRRSPIYAYGPGIAPGKASAEQLDQVDLAATMAALLGVSAPAHGLGQVLSDWLDLPETARARLTCDGAEGVLTYAEAMLERRLEPARKALRPCHDEASAAEDILAARSAVMRANAEVRESSGLAAPDAWRYALMVCLLAIVTACVALGRSVLRGAPAALALLVVALSLLFGVERLPGDTPNMVRIVILVLVNFGVLLLLFWPGRAASALERHPALAPVLIPGLLIASYTTNTQPESYVAMLVGALLFVLIGSVSHASPALFRGARLRVGRGELLLLLMAIATLSAAGTREGDLYPTYFVQRPWFVLAVAVAALSVWLFARRRGSKSKGLLLIVAVEIVATVGSLLLRRVVPPVLGRICIIAFALAALVAAQQRQTKLALSLGIASYAWVSRDFEILALVATLVVAETVGRALAPGRSESRTALGFGSAQLLLLTTFLFGLLYVQRVGIQGSLDFGSMDWGVAGFRDPNVSAILVGSALAYKYLLATLLVLGALLFHLGEGMRGPLAAALVATYSLRTAVLLLMLFVCGGSFWTGLRVLGDLPFALIGALAGAACWISVSYGSRSRPAL